MENDASTNLESLSRKELLEMIQQKNQTIAEQADTIARLLVNRKKTTDERAETEEEDE
jgi:hypothetical protein